MDSHNNAHLIVLIFLHLADKVSAIHKGEAVAPSVVLIGLVFAQHRKRIVLVAGSSAEAADGLNAVVQRVPVKLPFHGMPSVQVDKIIIRIHKIHCHGHEPVQINGLRALVHNPHRPGNHIFLFKHTVTEHSRKLRRLVLKPDFQGIHRVLSGRTQRGKAGQSIFPCIDLMPYDLSHESVASVPVLYFNAAKPVITAPIA